MRKYTGDNVLFLMERGYARGAQAGGVPEKPDPTNYYQGVLPLDTCPAPW